MEEEIDNSKENIILNNIPENSIQENIPTSFNDYFISILKELPSFFEKYSTPKKDLNIQRFINENKENKLLLDLLPINLVKSEDFIEPYTDYINFIHKKPNKIPHFTNFEQNEIQLLYLLENTHLANEKISQYEKEENVDNFTNNHLIKINNIIKSNPDLIGYIYILKWLQKIITLSFEDYNTDGNIYKIITDKNPISGETTDPIKIEEICQSETNEEYNNLMKQFSYYLFKGNIAACQEICQKRKIEEFSNVFSGGCPLFDKVISCENDFNFFDKDLISPTMHNKDFEEFLDLFKNNEEQNDEEKNVYGNSFYILWMQVMYENADLSKNGSLLNYLFRLVSGNYKNYELNNNNIYEYLYINILNLLHSKIFSELTRNPKHKMVQYHYIEPESFKEITQIINNGGRDIFSIIDSIMQNNNYSILCKKHPMLWLELSFIKLFFAKIQIKENNFLEKDIKNYLININDILNRMKKGNDFTFMDFDEIINNEREFNYSSQNNKKLQTREFYDMINICLFRAYFSSLVNFYYIENKFFERLVMFNNKYGEDLEKIYCDFDEIYINYIKCIINLNDKGNLCFDILIYITTYMFDIRSIIFILTEISHYIGTNEKYQEFIFYIKKFFENIIYNDDNLSLYLIRILTNNSNLLSMTDNQKHNFTCIDDALNYYVENKMNNLRNSSIRYGNENNVVEEISDDDKYKINQIMCLFEQTKENKLNQDTSFSYLLKLFIKFLVNYKYKEAYELKYQLRDYIYERDAPTEDLIYEKLSLIEQQIEKINNISDTDKIDFCTNISCRYLFIIILDCFYFYANKIMLLYNNDINNNSNNRNNLRTKSKKNYFNSELGLNVMQFITKKINILNRFIKKILENEYFFSYTLNYFGENTKNDFIKLIGDWAFQSIKWTCDVYKMGLVDRNKNNSLNHILDNMIYDKEIIDKHYLSNGLLAEDIINEEKEKKIYEMMSQIQKQKVVEMVYYMAKINRDYLEETFDDKFVKKLKEQNDNIIQDLEFDE